MSLLSGKTLASLDVTVENEEIELDPKTNEETETKDKKDLDELIGTFIEIFVW